MDSGAAWLRAAAALVYVSSLSSLDLRPEDAHHLGRVLRLRNGEEVAASDGAGSWRPCTWSSGGLVASGPVVAAPGGSVPAVAVGFVPTKGDRPEWVVQKLTELGVDRIVVLSSERSVVRWDDERGARHIAKLSEVARQAGMQSRRTALPTIEGVVPVTSLSPGGSGSAGSGSAGSGSGGSGSGRWGWLLAVPGGGPLPAGLPWAGDIGTGVLVGPEGGWSPDEEACGLPTVGLGPGILRAETAALAAATLLAALRSGVVAGPPHPAQVDPPAR